MSIISKPTNLSTEGNLLYEILRELDRLVGVISTSGGSYVLPAATTTTLGGVIVPVVGTSGITNSSGTITAATASTTQRGVVKVDGTTITINGSGVISSTGGTAYTFSNGITESAGSVKLGGPLIDLNTTISLNSNTLEISGGGAGIQMNGLSGNIDISGSVTNISGVSTVTYNSDTLHDFLVNGIALVRIQEAGFIIPTKSIDTTAGDSATIDSQAGRFRKDTSGSTFTLTNSFIEPNSIVITTIVTTGITTVAKIIPVAGSGSCVFTFESAVGVGAAPNANCDVNFWVIN